MQTRVLFSLTAALVCAVFTSSAQAQVVTNNLDGGSGSYCPNA